MGKERVVRVEGVRSITFSILEMMVEETKLGRDMMFFCRHCIWR
jgi:hypothetical protein